jgi:hypothetical protein
MKKDMDYEDEDEYSKIMGPEPDLEDELEEWDEEDDTEDYDEYEDDDE